jgi:hypothetical protein
LIVESFRLANDLDDCPGNGLRIGAPNITIDLNGKTLSGSGDPGEFGILNDVNENVITGFPGLTVKNGTVRGFDIGVANLNQSATFKRLEIVANVGAGLRSLGSGGRVLNNFVVGNGSQGVLIGGSLSDPSRVEGNEIASNGSGVLTFPGGSGVVIKRNTVSGNSGEGITSQVSGAKIVGNVVRSNGHGSGFNGIALTTIAQNNVVRGNTLNANGRHGYEDNGTNNEVVDNVARGNGYYQGVPNGVGLGIDTSGATDPVGSGNVASGNDDDDECDPSTFC